MAALTIDSDQQRALRAQAHHLKPVVMIASKGLTPAVLAEIDRALTAHELIKIRVTGAERDIRAQYLETICDTLDCAPVQLLGNLLLVWRPNPEKRAETPRASRAKTADNNNAAAFVRRARRQALTKKRNHS
ncbi:YhbY family RNA-binding protein [Hydrogenophilus hirschii]